MTRTVELPGWGVMTVYTCSACGEDFYVGAVETSPGWGPVDTAAFTRWLIGDPPRCAECRKSP